jgi:PTH1 family peptidyl-tRNA hydrolase
MGSTAMIQLIVGLGNPGQEYESTRHNAGAWFVEALAKQCGVTLLPEKKFHGLFAKVNLHGNTCYLLIPTTYMNNSGQSVAACADFYKLLPENILVAHDELDLPVGTTRLKFEGGHGGHNGLRDIFAHLNSPKFYRLRIGIGRPTAHHPVVDYVLHRPTKEEQTLIDQSLLSVEKILPDVLSGNIEHAMKVLHT